MSSKRRQRARERSPEADPVSRALESAPPRTTPLTPEQEAAWSRGLDDVMAGRFVKTE